MVNTIRDGGRIRGSGAEVSNRYFHVWTFGDDKVVRLSVHTMRKRALEAAGLSVLRFGLNAVVRDQTGWRARSKIRAS